MANLSVTYTAYASNRHQEPGVSIGEADRTEEIEIGATSTQGALTVAAGESLLELYAEADCAYRIGVNPTAVAGECRFLATGERAEHRVNVGSKIAVITVA